MYTCLNFRLFLFYTLRLILLMMNSSVIGVVRKLYLLCSLYFVFNHRINEYQVWNWKVSPILLLSVLNMIQEYIYSDIKIEQAYNHNILIIWMNIPSMLLCYIQYLPHMAINIIRVDGPLVFNCFGLFSR